MRTLGTESKLYYLKTVLGSVPAHFACSFSLLCDILKKCMYMDGYSNWKASIHQQPGIPRKRACLITGHDSRAGLDKAFMKKKCRGINKDKS